MRYHSNHYRLTWIRMYTQSSTYMTKILIQAYLIVFSVNNTLILTKGTCEYTRNVFFSTLMERRTIQDNFLISNSGKPSKKYFFMYFFIILSLCLVQFTVLFLPSFRLKMSASGIGHKFNFT